MKSGASQPQRSKRKPETPQVRERNSPQFEKPDDAQNSSEKKTVSASKPSKPKKEAHKEAAQTGDDEPQVGKKSTTKEKAKSTTTKKDGKTVKKDASGEFCSCLDH